MFAFVLLAENKIIIMLEHLEGVSPLTRIGVEQRTEKKNQMLNSHGGYSSIVLSQTLRTSYQEGVDGDDLEDAGGTEHLIIISYFRRKLSTIRQACSSHHIIRKTNTTVCNAMAPT